MTHSPRIISPHTTLDSLVGFPYKEPFGCFFLVREALALRGIHIPDYTTGLPESKKAWALITYLEKHAEPTADPQPHDLVLLNIGGQPGHIGILVTKTTMLHCQRGTNACIEPLTRARWRNRIAGYWRVSS